jgi:hypothetical protein
MSSARSCRMIPLPIERGAATRFIAPDGTETVVGKPLQLIGPDGGVRILDEGWVEFGEEVIVRGRTRPSGWTLRRTTALPKTEPAGRQKGLLRFYGLHCRG